MPLPPKPIAPLSPQRIEVFWSYVEKSAPGGCWAWTSYTRSGYGSFYDSQREVAAHRLAYELAVGPIPKGLFLDHLCCNKTCVNPAHLEPVTHRVNIMRGLVAAGIAASETTCPHGHEYTPENTYVRGRGGGRACRTCHRERQRRYTRKEVVL